MPAIGSTTSAPVRPTTTPVAAPSPSTCSEPISTPSSGTRLSYYEDCFEAAPPPPPVAINASGDLIGNTVPQGTAGGPMTRTLT